jgi:hypothetical protein
MPCVIILRDGLYDIVITTDRIDKIRKLYDFGTQLDACEEDWTPLNTKILETTGALWITSRTAIFNDEADFRKKFPDRKIPMCLNLRQAEKAKWYHGIPYLGFRYFQNRALSEDKDLAPMSDFPQNIFKMPSKGTDYEMLDHYMELVQLREKTLKLKQFLE